jgi:hypothetical protein
MRGKSSTGGSGFGSWYIGSGNKVSVFTSRPNHPFEKLRAVYGDQLNRLNRNGEKVTYRSLTEAEKNEIRTRVREALKRERLKKGLVLVFSIIVTIGLLFGFVYLVEMKLNKHYRQQKLSVRAMKVRNLE